MRRDVFGKNQQSSRAVGPGGDRVQYVQSARPAVSCAAAAADRTPATFGNVTARRVLAAAKPPSATYDTAGNDCDARNHEPGNT